MHKFCDYYFKEVLNSFSWNFTIFHLNQISCCCLWYLCKRQIWETQKAPNQPQMSWRPHLLGGPKLLKKSILSLLAKQSLGFPKCPKKLRKPQGAQKIPRGQLRLKITKNIHRDSNVPKVLMPKETKITQKTQDVLRGLIKTIQDYKKLSLYLWFHP